MSTILYIAAYFSALTSALPRTHEARAELSIDGVGDVIAALPGISVEIGPGSAFTTGGVEINGGLVDFTGIEIIAGPTGIEFSTDLGAVPSPTDTAAATSSTVLPARQLSPLPSRPSQAPFQPLPITSQPAQAPQSSPTPPPSAP